MKQTEILTHATHVNGWFPAVYMSCMSRNFPLFHVSNLSVRNFRIFLLMYTGSVWPQASPPVGRSSAYAIGRGRSRRGRQREWAVSLSRIRRPRRVGRDASLARRRPGSAMDRIPRRCWGAARRVACPPPSARRRRRVGRGGRWGRDYGPRTFICVEE